ncbi:MAG: hypothetical protein ACI3ZS_02920, partial [Candidatus Cryptobacteroides sp.]
TPIRRRTDQAHPPAGRTTQQRKIEKQHRLHWSQGRTPKNMDIEKIHYLCGILNEKLWQTAISLIM